MEWQKVKLIDKKQVAKDMVILSFAPEVFIPHEAGQFYQIKPLDSFLDRCYSLVSTPSQTDRLEFGIQLIPNGQVSPKLWNLAIGQEVEMIGPQGEFFNWKPEMTEPLLLLGGGSGMVPLLCIYRYAREVSPHLPITFIMSAKSSAHVMEYETMKENFITRFTHSEPRIDIAFLDASIPVDQRKLMRVYLCGPDGFVNAMTDDLLALGLDPNRIRSERFT